jgi:hypothetical protein
MGVVWTFRAKKTERTFDAPEQGVHSCRHFFFLRIMIALFTTHERTSMNNAAGVRISRLTEQKQRARRVRIGVVLALCALPFALAFAKAAAATLGQG